MSGLTKETQFYFDKVKQYFNGDVKKTWTWFKTPNPNLGMVSPLEMMRVGRMNKVAKYINFALDKCHRL